MIGTTKPNNKTNRIDSKRTKNERKRGSENNVCFVSQKPKAATKPSPRTTPECTCRGFDRWAQDVLAKVYCLRFMVSSLG